MTALKKSALFLGLFCLVVACQTLREDRGSSFARSAGESTIVLGGCSKPLTKGFESCQLERGKPLPLLQIAFLNPAEYAISDCELNLWKQGAVTQPTLLEIDVAELNDQIHRNGMCILKVETIERYPDPKNKTQFHEIPISGGFFVELLEPGYNPVPAPDVINWCYMVGRTTKGRTIMKKMASSKCK